MTDEVETQPPSATACQKCGRDSGPMGMQFQKREGARMFVAAMCDACSMEFFGLEWRETKAPPRILLAGVSPGARIA